MIALHCHRLVQRHTHACTHTHTHTQATGIPTTDTHYLRPMCCRPGAGTLGAAVVRHREREVSAGKEKPKSGIFGVR